MTLNSSGEGVMSEVAHGPSFLTFDVCVASGRGPTNPMEERGIRSWGADEGVVRGVPKLTSDCVLDTGGKGTLTQWVHCEFVVSFEAIRPVVTQQVCGEFF